MARDPARHPMTQPGSARGVDTSRCDREPIHRPAAIQPHGALLVVEPRDLKILQASENVEEFLGHRHPDVVARPLSDALDGDVVDALANAGVSGVWDEFNPLPVTGRNQALNAVVHGHDGAMIVELEPRQELVQADARHSLRRALANIQGSKTLTDLSQRVIEEVKRLSGFDRVMIYRFDEEGHGHVAAEVREPELDSYLGIHYPASDIPRQARELYTHSRLRIIPDAGYAPVPISPALRPDTGAPLDLTHAVLRSVSPVHCEYLQNMGVQASMSVSLVVRGQLWGLVSCTHHSGIRHLSYETRSACELIGRLMSLEIEALEEREAAAAREARRATEELLATAMREGASSRTVLTGLLQRPADLLGLVGANGAAVLEDDDCSICGDAPPPAFVVAVARWLDQHGERSIFSTGSLPALFPPAVEHQRTASGLLSFALPGVRSRRLLWFRPERIGTVRWGGDPRKPFEQDPTGGRPHPRRSFELWTEEVRLRSLAWSASDIEAATSLRRYAIEIDLERQVLREQRAVRARDEIMAIVSHDLRSPLSVMDLQAKVLLETLNEEDGSLRTTATRIQRSVARMNSLINNLLDLASIEAGGFSLALSEIEVRELLEDSLGTLGPLAEAKGIRVDCEVSGAPRVHADRDRVFQVFANLFSNAVKFTPSGGSITLRAESGEGHVLFTLSDTGSGIAAADLPYIFDRYWRSSDSEGVGIGLFVVKGIVEAHGGTIRATTGTGSGTTFTFSLPVAGSD